MFRLLRNSFKHLVFVQKYLLMFSLFLEQALDI